MIQLSHKDSGRAITSDVFSIANIQALSNNRPHVPAWADRTPYSLLPQREMIASFIQQLENPEPETPVPHIAAEPDSTSLDSNMPLSPDGIVFASDLLPAWWFSSFIHREPARIDLPIYGSTVSFPGRPCPQLVSLQLFVSPEAYRIVMPFLCDYCITNLTFGPALLSYGYTRSINYEMLPNSRNLVVDLELEFHGAIIHAPDGSLTYNFCIHGMQPLNNGGLRLR